MSTSSCRLRRALGPARILILLLLSSCGLGGTGATTGEPQVGGVFMPGKLTYGSIDMVGEGGDESDLPSQVDLRRDGVVPPIQNQRWNNCVGWALGYYLMSGLEMRNYREHAWFTGNILNPADPENWFSPDYLYSQRELKATDIVDRSPHLSAAPMCLEQDKLLGCMRPEIAITRLMQYGCCRWPFLCAPDQDNLFRSCSDGGAATTSRAPWTFAEPNGFWFRPRCFVRFGVLREPGASSRTSPVRQMQRWLHEQGTPIAIVVEMKEGWVTYRGQNRTQAPVLFGDRNDGLTEERAVCLDAGGQSLRSQHMMTIIGYDREFIKDDENPAGSFLVANQWGTKWGHEGYMWIPVSELEKIWIGGYGLIKWIGGSGTSLNGPTVCAPDEYGAYKAVSVQEVEEKGLDGNDVPRNVVREEGGQYVYEQTATPLTFDDDEALSASGVTVGGLQNGVIDTADWYALGEAFDGQVVECTLTSTLQGDRGPVLRMKVTDSELRQIGVFCPRRGVTTAPLGKGPHFIKVEPTYGAGYEALPKEQKVPYTLSVRLNPAPAPGDDCVLDLVPSVLPLIRSELVAVEIKSQEWQCFRLNLDELRALGWGTNSDGLLQEEQILPRIQVSGLGSGQTVQVVAAGPVPWWHKSIALRGFRDFELRAVAESGLDLTINPAGKAPGTSSFNEWDPFVAIRNTSAESVHVTLVISILPPQGQPNNKQPDDPGIEQVPDLERPAWWVPGDATHANRFRVLPNDWRNPETELIELRHASPEARLKFLDESGNELNGVQVEDLSAGTDPALRPAGVLRQRVKPGLSTEHIWVEVYEDNDGTKPLRNLRLRRYHVNTLAQWPMSAEAPVDPREKDDVPSGATPLVAGTPRDATIGFTLTGPGGGYSWDFYDYYVVENQTTAARAATLDLTKTGADLLLFRWRLDDFDAPRSLGSVSSTGGSFSLLDGNVLLAPGSRVLVLVFSGSQAITNYSLKLTWN